MTDERPKLVIDRLAKIQENATAPKQNQTASREAVLVKWVTSIIIALLFLTCLVTSKISLLALSEAMNATNGLNLIDRSRLFVMLQIIALAPNVVNLIRGVWCGLLRRDRNYPSQWGKWFVATIMSVIESFGICMFVFCIPGISKPQHTILLMNCVFVVPLLDNIRLLINRRRQRNEQARQPVDIPGGKWAYVFWTIALMAEIAGIALTMYLLRRIPKEKIVIPFVGVLCLSIPWIPSVQKYLVENTWEYIDTSQCFQDTTNENRPSTSAFTIQEPSCGSDENVTAVKKIERTAWKLTTWMSFVKFLSTMVFSLMIYFSDALSPFPDGLGTVDVQTYAAGWADLRGGSVIELIYVIGHITAGFIGYVVGYVACTTRSQVLGFSIPLMAATPLTVILMTVSDSCRLFLLYPGVINAKHECSITDNGILFLTFGTAFLVLAQVLSTGWLLLRSQLIVMLGEDQLFWTPMYNSALLEHWIMLSRRNEHTDLGNVNLNPFQNARRSRIFICTTMYRETKEEMILLLESLKEINERVTHSTGMQFECHIFFDGAVRHDIPTEYLLQLVALVEETLGTPASRCTKMITPYGMSLSWRLVSQNRQGMYFTIHLKDNSKVKNKKRWSQVMYMSFILDVQLENSQRDINYDIEEESYILTTDADVKFTPDNVEALLDLMTLDYSVGAVCARTHPLGRGPVVWYQKFEYAIGHWFQKAAEHVIGSVLCSPGCFSIYRCKAIKDVLPMYASNVEKAEEFLTKDMGEDRWLCTLLIQSGWRIEYCAASENKTHCPEEFDEFFKQRRRWIASTLANLWLLIKEWKYIIKNNLRVSFLFIIYQVILLVATLIGPSSVILVVCGGLKYGRNWDPAVTMTLQLVLCICFTFICLSTSQKVQLYAAKFLTCLYACIMMIVIVGTVVEIATDIKGDPGSEHNFISDKIRISTTSVYLFSMAGIFVIAGVLHLKEIGCLLLGFFYLLFLPAGYLILIIYSICNITDSSWGTRERVQKPTAKSWDNFKKFVKKIFFCCSDKDTQDNINVSVQTSPTDIDVSNGAQRLSSDQPIVRGGGEDPNERNGQAPATDTRDITSYTSEERTLNIQRILMALDTRTDESSEMHIYWNHLTERCLVPKSAVFESDDRLKVNLAELRNQWLAIFIMINLLWLILISTLAEKGELLGVLGSNPVGFCVIVLFGFVLIVQFFAMIVHRIFSLMHFLGRTPYTWYSKYNGSWMFDRSDTLEDEDDIEHFDIACDEANRR